MKASAVVLAAGGARRFGSDKLAADLDGKSVLQHVLDGLATFDFHEIVMVTRPDRTIVAPGVRRIDNPHPDDGMGRSLSIGVSSLALADAAFIVLADMPFLPRDIFGQLVVSLANHDIVVPRYHGQAGHPVLFSSVCFADLRCLEGDRGARALIDSGRYRVHFMDVDSDGVLRDVDRPDDLYR